MHITRHAQPTLTAVEMDVGDTLEFVLLDGTRCVIELVRTRACVHETNLTEPRQPRPCGRTVCRMHADLRINGTAVSLVRWVGSDRSFYEPWELQGVRFWFDACANLFDHLTETHGACKPRRQARFALQDARARICPPLLHPWCPLPARGLRIADCYDACDCWLGPYFGAEAHGGLDINHPAGTPLWTPFAVDEHGLFDSLQRGANNNRWRGLRHWPDGSVWVVQSHHLIRLLVPEDQPIAAGVQYAEGAGVWVGSHEHSHFVFGVRAPGETETILLDPWILFWQMYRDRRLTQAPD